MEGYFFTIFFFWLLLIESYSQNRISIIMKPMSVTAIVNLDITSPHFELSFSLYHWTFLTVISLYHWSRFEL